MTEGELHEAVDVILARLDAFAGLGQSLRADPGDSPGEVPDAVDLRLWPHCRCLDIAVFGHRRWCTPQKREWQLSQAGIDQESSALQ